MVEEGSGRYSFDVVAARDDDILMIKFAENLDEESAKRFMDDLKSLSISLEATPLLACEEVPDDILVTYEGVPSVSPRTLERVLKGERLPFVYVSRGGVYVRVRNESIRQLRREKGMSLGELSLRAGVTRRMIYEYETGRADATLEVARRLAQVLGEGVLERMTIAGIREFTARTLGSGERLEGRIRDPILKQVYEKLTRAGFIGLPVKRAPFHIAAKRRAGYPPAKLVLRKNSEPEGEAEEEELTLRVAVLCRSLVLFIRGERSELVSGEATKTVHIDRLDEQLSEILHATRSQAD